MSEEHFKLLDDGVRIYNIWKDETQVSFVDKIVEYLGKASFEEGQMAPERVVHMSSVNIISRTCRFCGCVITGPDYNVWHVLSAHEVGHSMDAAQLQLNSKYEDDDDGESNGLSV